MSPPTPLPPHSLSSPYERPNQIDLTLDDEDGGDQYASQRFLKRARTEPSYAHANHPQLISSRELPPLSGTPSSMSPFASYNSQQAPGIPNATSSKFAHTSSSTFYPPNSPQSQGMYRPAFAGPSAFFAPRHSQHLNTPSPSSSPGFPSAPTHNPYPVGSESPNRQVIDLTGSPSPPPAMLARQPTPSTLPPELPPKTPVCIGQLTVTALVLYPVPYILPQDPNSGEPEWAPVRLQYEHNPHKPGGSETIHIKAPHGRGPNGETIAGEGFGVIEQKVATFLGPMLGKGLIRLDAKVRKGPANVRTLISYLISEMFMS